MKSNVPNIPYIIFRVNYYEIDIKKVTDTVKQSKI